MLKGQGWGAWPACSAKLHLSGSVAAAATRSAPRVSRSAVRHPLQTGGRHVSSRQVSSRQVSSPHVSSRRAGGRHVAPAQTYGRHSAGTYVVRPGDYLSAIAARHRTPGGWQTLYALNRTVIGKNPNLVFAGQHLRLR